MAAVMSLETVLRVRCPAGSVDARRMCCSLEADHFSRMTMLRCLVAGRGGVHLARVVASRRRS